MNAYVATEDTAALDRAIGRRVRNARIDRAVNQTELARCLGITQQQVVKYETGTHRVSASRLVHICRALACSVEDLLGGLVESTPDG